MKSRFRDWGDIRLFLAVVRHGSTLAAAHALEMTQTTVARRISALEHALGLRLFERDTRGFQVTPAGSALIAAAEALEQSALALDSAANAQRLKAAAPIRFTAWDEMIILGLAEVFSDFTDANPGVQFEFIADERPLDLSAGEADIALRFAPAIKDQKLKCRRIGTAQWTYYASERYARQYGLPQSYDADMRDHTVVMLKHIPSNRPRLHRCDSSADLIMAIHTGRGIGPILTFQGDRERGLVRCFPPPQGAGFPVWLLTSPAAHRRAEVRRFTAYAAPRIAAWLKGVGADADQLRSERPRPT